MYYGWKDIPTIFEIDFGGGQVDSQSCVRRQTRGGMQSSLGGVKYKNIDRNRFGYLKKSHTLVIFSYIQVSDHQVRKVQLLEVFAGAM